ncbi:hypothetical protein ACP70R_001705 [Stipagrostis hirtigluma subsp. patula]
MGRRRHSAISRRWGPTENLDTVALNTQTSREFPPGQPDPTSSRHIPPLVLVSSQLVLVSLAAPPRSCSAPPQAPQLALHEAAASCSPPGRAPHPPPDRRISRPLRRSGTTRPPHQTTEATPEASMVVSMAFWRGLCGRSIWDYCTGGEVWCGDAIPSPYIYGDFRSIFS